MSFVRITGVPSASKDIRSGGLSSVISEVTHTIRTLPAVVSARVAVRMSIGSRRRVMRCGARQFVPISRS